MGHDNEDDHAKQAEAEEEASKHEKGIEDVKSAFGRSYNNVLYYLEDKIEHLWPRKDPYMGQQQQQQQQRHRHHTCRRHQSSKGPPPRKCCPPDCWRHHRDPETLQAAVQKVQESHALLAALYAHVPPDAESLYDLRVLRQRHKKDCVRPSLEAYMDNFWRRAWILLDKVDRQDNFFCDDVTSCPPSPEPLPTHNGLFLDSDDGDF